MKPEPNATASIPGIGKMDVHVPPIPEPEAHTAPLCYRIFDAANLNEWTNDGHTVSAQLNTSGVMQNVRCPHLDASENPIEQCIIDWALADCCFPKQDTTMVVLDDNLPISSMHGAYPIEWRRETDDTIRIRIAPRPGRLARLRSRLGIGGGRDH